jgi:hypothetical protein
MTEITIDITLQELYRRGGKYDGTIALAYALPTADGMCIIGPFSFHMVYSFGF